MERINLKTQNSMSVYSDDKKKNPNFRGGISSVLNMSGNLMQGIENTGFLGSFLIQDFGGMTVPRTIAGFNRDKELTGHYNMQEGFEVLGRESLTGPAMMAVAPITFLIAGKFLGKSTGVNTQLIKRFGNSLKQLVSSENFDKNLLKDADKFRQEFYKINVENILKQTLGDANVSVEYVNYILKELNNIHNIPSNIKLSRINGKGKYRKQCIANISDYIDNILYSKTSNLEMLNKVKFGDMTKLQTFSTNDALEGLIKYTEDAITANKHLDKLDELACESIQNKSIAKRIITNIATVFSTLGVLSVLPKIYARSNVAPGARKNTENNIDEKHSNQISFKSKNYKGVLESFGKFIKQNSNDFVSSELEYNGHNFTNTLMSVLSIFGLLLPRGARAYSRAQVDSDGKKDLTEIWEIILRDLTSSLSVVFAVPMLTRACVSSYEDKFGFVLMNKDRNVHSKFMKAIDLINPYSKAHVLTNSEISSLYNNIDTKDKMLNFCKYVDSNGGDLQKILSKSENANEIFNNKTNTLESLKKLSKSDKNKKIIKIISELDVSNADGIIKKMMLAVGKGKFGKITSFARGLNSVPALISTFLISPYLLGWAIPKFTYANTRRIHAKQEDSKQNKLSQNNQITNNLKVSI